MSQVTRETVVTNEVNNVPVARSSVSRVTNIEKTATQKFSQIIYFFLGALEVLLVFRFILKLTGASQGSTFVQFIYSVSGIFILPFEGIFRRAVADGAMTSSVVEPATIIAMIVYAILAWGVVALIKMLSGEAETQ